MTSQQLPLTGERTVPGAPREEYWFFRHEAVYRWLLSSAGVGAPESAGSLAGAQALSPAGAQALVVDAGCGEGYGAAMIAAAGPSVLALDYDEAAVEHVRRTYPQVRALRANLAALPVADGAATAVVSLQVVEHLWNLGEFLGECRRVLAPGGTLIVSTPNRPVFSPGLGRGERPTNPFHVEEFDAGQVSGMLEAAGFCDVVVHGLHHGPRILAWEAEHGSIIDAHVRGALRNDWPAALLEFLPGITAEDFSLGGTEGAQDLIGVGTR